MVGQLSCHYLVRLRDNLPHTDGGALPPNGFEKGGISWQQ